MCHIYIHQFGVGLRAENLTLLKGFPASVEEETKAYFPPVLIRLPLKHWENNTAILTK